MKIKQLLLTAGMVCISVAAFAQGQVTFGNSTTTRIYYTNGPGNLAAGAPFVNGMPVSNSWQVTVGLYYAIGSNTNGVVNPAVATDALTLLGTTTISAVGALAGVFSGGTANVTGSNPGDNALLQVRAWSSAYATYDAAMTAALGGNTSVVVGASKLMYLALGGAPLPVPSLTSQGGLTSMFVSPVPEPSIIGLGALGLLGLVFLRRRK